MVLAVIDISYHDMYPASIAGEKPAGWECTNPFVILSAAEGDPHLLFRNADITIDSGCPILAQPGSPATGLRRWGGRAARVGKHDTQFSIVILSAAEGSAVASSALKGTGFSPYKIHPTCPLEINQRGVSRVQSWSIDNAASSFTLRTAQSDLAGQRDQL